MLFLAQFKIRKTYYMGVGSRPEIRSDSRLVEAKDEQDAASKLRIHFENESRFSALVEIEDVEIHEVIR